jgi:rhodanese-related sulfurtransferase
MRILMTLFAILLVVSAVFSLACSGGDTTVGTKINVEGGSYTSINSAELYQMLQNKDFLLVNTDPMPTAGIENTDFYIPVSELITDLSLVSENKAEKIVIYCMIGANSSVVAAEFAKTGYTSIYNLSGGIVGWQQQGYPVVLP